MLKNQKVKQIENGCVEEKKKFQESGCGYHMSEGVKIILKEKGMNHKDLALALGRFGSKDQNIVSALLNRRTGWAEQRMNQVAEILRTPVSEIIHRGEVFAKIDPEFAKLRLSKAKKEKEGSIGRFICILQSAAEGYPAISMLFSIENVYKYATTVFEKFKSGEIKDEKLYNDAQYAIKRLLEDPRIDVFASLLMESMND